MKNGLIGSSGFVGGNLKEQISFEELYDHENIDSIKGRSFDLLICAAPGAAVYLANQDPQKDLEAINDLISRLKTVKAKRFVLISTVDVYKQDGCVNQAYEDSVINRGLLEPYGQNRLILSDYIQRAFKDHLILRLPGLFGPGLKKNFIYDMIHTGKSEWTRPDSIYQFFNLGNISAIINKALAEKISILNVTSEPISAKELAKDCFGVDFDNQANRPAVVYDMRTRYAKKFGGKNGYIYSREQIITDIKAFAAKA